MRIKMAEDMLVKLKTIASTALTDVVRQDQHNSFFEITEWSVKRLSDKGIMNPDGLWLFRGEGHDNNGSRPWSVVLKILEGQTQETPQDDPWYWKRELLLAQSGLLERLPGPVRAPRFYRTVEYPDSAWLWMEHIVDQQPGHWTLEQYTFAAHQLGRWNGACLASSPLQEELWLARRHYIPWLRWMNVEKDWQFPLNQMHVSAISRQRYDQLWAEREIFYGALEGLPQVFSHFDSQRRNLFIHQDEDQKDELVLVDWAQCGLGPIGAELNWLIGMSGGLLEWSPSDLFELDAAAFESYLQGLRETGWSGDRDIVRLGYVAWLAVFMGCIFPGFTALWCSAENRLDALQSFGLAEEELFWQILPLLNYSLDCADEARTLMKKMGV
jgi:hypothetical protein